MASSESWQDRLSLQSKEDQLFYMFKHGIHTDVVFVVGADEQETSIEAHKLVLLLNSEHFESCLQNRWEHFLNKSSDGKTYLHHRGVNPAAMKAFVTRLYKNSMEPSDVHEAMAILALAQYFLCSGILRKTILYLIDKMNIENIVEIHACSKLHDIEKLSKASMEFIGDHAQELFSREDIFNTFSVHQLQDILKDDELAIEEISVFNAIYNYGKYLCEIKDLPQEENIIREKIEALIPLIRFTLIPIDVVTERILQTKILTKDEQLQICYFHNLTVNKRKTRLQKEEIRQSLSMKFNIKGRRELSTIKYVENIIVKNSNFGFVSYASTIEPFQVCFSVNYKIKLFGLQFIKGNQEEMLDFKLLVCIYKQGTCSTVELLNQTFEDNNSRSSKFSIEFAGIEINPSSTYKITFRLLSNNPSFPSIRKISTNQISTSRQNKVQFNFFNVLLLRRDFHLSQLKYQLILPLTS